MLTVYLACLALGGVMLVASLLGGHDHDVGDGDVGGASLGPGHAGDGAAATGAHGSIQQTDTSHAHAAPNGILQTLLSLRFWSFGLTFFGLGGAVLAGLGLVSPGTAVALAVVLGLGTGYGASRAFQFLDRTPVGVIPAAASHVGSEGRVLLPVGLGQRGKVRLHVAGTDVDMIAETDGSVSLAVGDTALVVGLRGHAVVVEPSPGAAGRTSDGKEEAT